MSGTPGRVSLIGAGPGEPTLITTRGLHLLEAADVVVYDRDAGALLRWARPDAERLEVGAPAERDTAQDAISMLLAEKAREGLTVARLKWGDAFVFDSGAKEALFLHEQGIPFEVVPGVPVAIGATAYAGIPLTYPGGSDALVLLRGHEAQTDALPDVDWHALARLDATIVCYTGGRVASAVLDALLGHGLPADRAAALVYRGTLPAQETIAGPAGELAERAAARSDPGLLVVGEVARLREHLRWFDERPLFGRRILVTRSREQARDLCETLEGLGAHAIEAATFLVTPPEDPEAVDRAASSAATYDWIVFESANTVDRFLTSLTRGPRDLRALGGVSLCAIGPSTAERLRAHAIKPDVVIPEFRAEGVGETLEGVAPLGGRRVLIVRPDHLRDTLANDLIRRGALVTDLVAYPYGPRIPGFAGSPGAVPDAPRRRRGCRAVHERHGRAPVRGFVRPGTGRGPPEHDAGRLNRARHRGRRRRARHSHGGDAGHVHSRGARAGAGGTFWTGTGGGLGCES